MLDVAEHCGRAYTSEMMGGIRFAWTPKALWTGLTSGMPALQAAKRYHGEERVWQALGEKLIFSG